jgi:hypothetical protein
MSENDGNAQSHVPLCFCLFVRFLSSCFLFLYLFISLFSPFGKFIFSFHPAHPRKQSMKVVLPKQIAVKYRPSEILVCKHLWALLTNKRNMERPFDATCKARLEKKSKKKLLKLTPKIREVLFAYKTIRDTARRPPLGLFFLFLTAKKTLRPLNTTSHLRKANYHM